MRSSGRNSISFSASMFLCTSKLGYQWQIVLSGNVIRSTLGSREEIFYRPVDTGYIGRFMGDCMNGKLAIYKLLNTRPRLYLFPVDRDGVCKRYALRNIQGCLTLMALIKKTVIMDSVPI